MTIPTATHIQRAMDFRAVKASGHVARAVRAFMSHVPACVGIDPCVLLGLRESRWLIKRWDTLSGIRHLRQRIRYLEIRYNG